MNAQFIDVELGQLCQELNELNIPAEYENTGGGCESITWLLPEGKQEVLITNLDQPAGIFVLAIYDTETKEQTDYFGEFTKEDLIRSLQIFVNMISEGGN